MSDTTIETVESLSESLAEAKAIIDGMELFEVILVLAELAEMGVEIRGPQGPDDTLNAVLSELAETHTAEVYTAAISSLFLVSPELALNVLLG